MEESSFNRIKWILSTPPSRRSPEQVTEVKELLQPLSFFQRFNDELLSRLVARGMHMYCAGGAYVFRKGDMANALFVVLQGAVHVVNSHDDKSEETVAAELGVGEFFGEVALLNDTRRTAGVRAAGGGVHCFVLPRAAYSELLKKSHQKAGLESSFIQRVIASAALPPPQRKEQDIDNLLALIRGGAVFKQLTEDALIDVAKKAAYRFFQRGDVIFRKGQKGGSFFVLLQGSVQLFLPPALSQPERIIKTVHACETFGDIALLLASSPPPRSSSARSVADVHVLEIEHSTYVQLLAHHAQEEIADKVRWMRRVFPILTPPPSDSIRKLRSQQLLLSLSLMLAKTTCQKGDVLCDMGEPLKCLRFVVKGRVALSLTAEFELRDPHLANLSAAEQCTVRQRSNRLRATKLLQLGDMMDGECIGGQEWFAVNSIERLSPSRRPTPGYADVPMWNRPVTHCYRVVCRSDDVVLADIKTKNWRNIATPALRHEQFSSCLLTSLAIRKRLESELKALAASGWHLIQPLHVPILVPSDPQDQADGTINLRHLSQISIDNNNSNNNSIYRWSTANGVDSMGSSNAGFLVSSREDSSNLNDEYLVVSSKKGGRGNLTASSTLSPFQSQRLKNSGNPGSANDVENEKKVLDNELTPRHSIEEAKINPSLHLSNLFFNGSPRNAASSSLSLSSSSPRPSTHHQLYRTATSPSSPAAATASPSPRIQARPLTARPWGYGGVGGGGQGVVDFHLMFEADIDNNNNNKRLKKTMGNSSNNTRLVRPGSGGLCGQKKRGVWGGGAWEAGIIAVGKEMKQKPSNNNNSNNRRDDDNDGNVLSHGRSTTGEENGLWMNNGHEEREKQHAVAMGNGSRYFGRIDQFIDDDCSTPRSAVSCSYYSNSNSKSNTPRQDAREMWVQSTATTLHGKQPDEQGGDKISKENISLSQRASLPSTPSHYLCRLASSENGSERVDAQDNINTQQQSVSSSSPTFRKHPPSSCIDPQSTTVTGRSSLLSPRLASSSSLSSPPPPPHSATTHTTTMPLTPSFVLPPRPPSSSQAHFEDEEEEEEEEEEREEEKERCRHSVCDDGMKNRNSNNEEGKNNNININSRIPVPPRGRPQTAPPHRTTTAARGRMVTQANPHHRK